MKNILKKIIPPFLLNFYYLFVAFLAASLNGFSSKKITVIGVTGTKGKSSVVEMISKIFEEAGHKTASLSSIRFKIGSQEQQNKTKMTMPGRFFIQEFLRQAVLEECEYAVIEVTSEGIKQFRHKFIDFKAAVFTNLSPEHIESHGGFENYKKAKGELFKITKGIHVINLDDKNTDYFLNFSSQEKYGFSLKPQAIRKESGIKIIEAQNLNVGKNNSSFCIKGSQFKLNLLGEFNVYNALAAISVAISQKIPLKVCTLALEKIKTISGRAEIVAKDPFLIIVDYAHTPDSLKSVYKAVSSRISNESKMICVLGAAGGGRDKWKRPVLGKIASENCQEIIITNEDPYNENPVDIIRQVADGAGFSAKKILDRREAISQALKSARAGDAVVVTGKGSEPWMCVNNGQKIPWDDRKIVLEELEKIKYENKRNS